MCLILRDLSLISRKRGQPLKLHDKRDLNVSIKALIHISETKQGREVQYIYDLFEKEKEDIEIEEKSLFKIKGFFILFPNHVQLVNSKIKVKHVSQTLVILGIQYFPFNIEVTDHRPPPPPPTLHKIIQFFWPDFT